MILLLGFAIPVTAFSTIEDFNPKAYLTQFTDDPRAIQGITCESNWRAGVWGDNGNALGRPQFWESTFYRMQKASGDNPMYKWGDERAELRIYAWALENGHSGEWTCLKPKPPTW